MLFSGLLLAQGASAQDAAQLHDSGRQLLTTMSADDARAAQPLLQRALDGHRAEGNEAGAAEALYALALAAAFSGDADQARRLDEQAIATFSRLGDPLGEAAARDHLGTLLAAAGELPAARTQLQQAVGLRGLVGDAAGEAVSMHNLASVHLQTGEAGQALELFATVVDRHRQLGDLAGLAASLNNRGLLWLYVGRLDRGREDLIQALALQHQLGNQQGQASIDNNLGLLAWFQQGLPAARQSFAAALVAYRDLGDVAGRAEVLGNLGLVDLESGDSVAARQRIEAAIDLAEEHGLSRIAAAHLGSLGRVELAEDRFDEALGALQRAASSMRRMDDAWSLAVTLYDLARVQQRRRNPAAALQAIDEALATLESVRTSLHIGDLRAHLLASQRHIYDLRIDLLMAAGDAAEALATAEQARARGLFDLLRLAGGRRGVALEPVSLEQQGGPKLGVKDWQQLLDSDTEMILYHVGHAKAWAWVLDQQRLEGFSLGAAEDLEQLAQQVYRHLSLSHQRRHRGPARQMVAALAEKVLQPWQRRGRRRLVVVADGALHRIPFGVLTATLDTDHEVVHLPSLAVLAQLRQRPARQMRQPRQAPDVSQLAILADPVFATSDPRFTSRGLATAAASAATTTTTASSEAALPNRSETTARLPHSGVEAEQVAELFQVDSIRVAVGFEATRELVLSGELDEYRHLHFATHTVIDDQHPERSGLLLSQIDRSGRSRDGFVGLSDLFDLRLAAELVVLSACRSALGPQLRGEGLIGLSRGFFAAGARQVVVSLWDVDDRATAELMTYFYRALFADSGRDVASALASAQQQLRQDPRWSAPFYWAGFVLLGDWR